MTTAINQNILEIDHGIIVQQVNCQGVMGAGLAKKIADKWPVVKEEYLNWLNPNDDPSDSLGSFIFTRVTKAVWVYSIFGQINYGRTGVHTNYWALLGGLKSANEYAQKLGRVLYIPHGIGCGLAGGDWHVVSALIEQEVPDAIICKWDGEGQTVESP